MSAEFNALHADDHIAEFSFQAKVIEDAAHHSTASCSTPLPRSLRQWRVLLSEVLTGLCPRPPTLSLKPWLAVGSGMCPIMRSQAQAGPGPAASPSAGLVVLVLRSPLFHGCPQPSLSQSPDDAGPCAYTLLLVAPSKTSYVIPLQLSNSL